MLRTKHNLGVATMDGRYLLLDQTTPQTVASGKPIFSSGIEMGNAVLLGGGGTTHRIVMNPNDDAASGVALKVTAGGVEHIGTVSNAALSCENSFNPLADSSLSLGSTSMRWLEVWADDIESTNMPTVGGVALDSTFLKLDCSNFSFGADILCAVGGQAFLQMNWAGTISSVMVAGYDSDGKAVSGSVVVDVWKDVDANYPPTVADTITASAKPTISSGYKATDSTLTGWTKTFSAGDWFVFNIDSFTTIVKARIQIKYTRT